MVPAYLKVIEIEKELKRLGLAKETAPEWVQQFPAQKQMSDNDFLDWLQFIYLPNCYNKSSVVKTGHIVLQAKKFWKDDWQKGKLLQLLIELDALI